MKRIAYYAGSFDPLTNGHLSVLEQAMSLVDDLVVGIGIHPGKTPMFTFEQRKELVHEATRDFAGTVTVESFDGLVVDAASSVGATLLIRGIRDGTDLDYEMQMAGMNATMQPEIQTVFLPASPETRHITATLVRQISNLGGDVSPFVPPVTLKALEAKTTR